MKTWVLDASALLALFHGEIGKELVASVVSSSAISSVNLAEVVSKLLERGSSQTKVKVRLQNIYKIGLKVVPFSQSHALVTGLLHKETKKLGLSLGDRGCIALAESLRGPILTGDKAWLKLDQERFRVLCIR